MKSTLKNFSWLTLHAAETEGKFPHLFSEPKLGEPSLLKVPVNNITVVIVIINPSEVRFH